MKYAYGLENIFANNVFTLPKLGRVQWVGLLDPTDIESGLIQAQSAGRNRHLCLVIAYQGRIKTKLSLKLQQPAVESRRLSLRSGQVVSTSSPSTSPPVTPSFPPSSFPLEVGPLKSSYGCEGAL